MRQSNKIFRIYQSLKQKYGRPQGQWALWCKRPKTKKEQEEVIIGAVLTQHTNWKNVELVICNLKMIKTSGLKAILKLGSKDKAKLTVLIRPSGFYKQKTECLSNLAKFVANQYGSLARMAREPYEKLRLELLELKGFGPETVDSILLYALEKPVFVIDEYTRSLVKRERISKNLSYEHLRRLFENNLPRDWRLYQDFHALIVIDGKKKN